MEGSKQSPLFIYLGDDQNYWQDVLQAFKTNYPELSFRSRVFFDKNPSNIQGHFKTIQEMKPDAIFVDFTLHFHDHLHITRLLTRTNSEKAFVTIGLIEGTDQKQALKRSLLTGIAALFVKSNEMENLLYSIMCMVFPNQVKEHGFATASLEDSTKLFLPARASIIKKGSIHIESNYKLKENTEQILHSFLSYKNILHTPLTELVEQSSKNLFYSFSYAQAFKFLFAELTEDKKLDDYKEEVVTSSEKVNDWIENHKALSFPKLTKTLMIDRSFLFYQREEKSDSYPFILRCQPYLKEAKEEVLKSYSDLIVFRFDDIPEVESDKTQEEILFPNDEEALFKIIKACKEIPDYKPFILIFNNQKISSEEIKQRAQYEQLLIYSSEILPELVLKMATILNNKLEEKYKIQREEAVYLDKQNDDTYIELEKEITILKCSENDIVLKTADELPLMSPLRIKKPFEAIITLVAPPTHVRLNEGSYGLISGVGEIQKMELRKFINSVFFRQKEAKKLKEKEDYEKLKASALEKKLMEQNPTSDEEE